MDLGKAGHAALLSNPVISMTGVMGLASLAGILAIAYYDAVFAACAAHADRLAQAAQFTFQVHTRHHPLGLPRGCRCS